MNSKNIFAAFSAVYLWLAIGSVALANNFITRPGATRPDEASFTPMLGISGSAGLEGGIKVDYLMANPGFIPKLNNSVFIEGAFFVAQDGGPFLAPELRWEFHLHPEWTVYGEGGLEVDFDSKRKSHGAELVFIAGAVWRVPEKSFKLRGEVDAAHGAARAGPQIGF